MSVLQCSFSACRKGNLCSAASLSTTERVEMRVDSQLVISDLSSRCGHPYTQRIHVFYILRPKPTSAALSRQISYVNIDIGHRGRIYADRQVLLDIYSRQLLQSNNTSDMEVMWPTCGPVQYQCLIPPNRSERSFLICRND